MTGEAEQHVFQTFMAGIPEDSGRFHDEVEGFRFDSDSKIVVGHQRREFVLERAEGTRYRRIGHHAIEDEPPELGDAIELGGLFLCNRQARHHGQPRNRPVLQRLGCGDIKQTQENQ